MSLRSSQRINWKQGEKLASTQLSTYSRRLPQRPAPLAQGLVDRDHVAVAEMLDDHEQHAVGPFRAPPRSDFQRGRMSFNPRQTGVEACPGRRGFGPDGRRRRRQIGIVKRSSADENNCGSLFRLAEHIRPASGAETPVHGRAAVGLAYVVGERTGNGDVLGSEERADRPGPGAEILADAAPAISRAERRPSLDLVPHRPAQATARNRQEKAPI